MNLFQKISSFFEQKRLIKLTDSASFYRFIGGSWRGSGVYSGDKLADLYRRNELAYACISKIADVLNDAELIVEKQNNKGEWEKVSGHPLAALMKKPNSQEIGLDFRKKMCQSEYSLGLVYIRLIRPRPMAVPAEFYILNPNRVTPMVNYGRTAIEYFQYTNPLGYLENIAPEDILIRRRADLTDEFAGLAPLQVAANTIDGDENLTDYINSFFDSKNGNAGVPAGILKFTGTLSPEQANLKRKLWNKNTKANETQVLDQNAEFQSLGTIPDDLASDSIRAQNDARICGIFGVPAILVSAYVGYLHTTQNATAKSALKDFWLNKISPELKHLREWLTWFVLPQFEDINLIRQEKIRVGWDLSQMLALQEDLDALHDRERKDFQAGGITLNEFRLATGRKPDAKGDYYLQPFNLAAISPENRALEAVRKVEQGTNPNEPENKPEEEETSKRFQLKAATAHDFSSTQVDIPAAEKKIILAFGKDFISDEDLADEIDWEPREDKPHITVKFGLHTDNADDLKELLADVEPFEVTLRKTSIFAGKGETNYDVVKIDVESDALHALNKLISDNLETTDTHPKYIPHLTLAYVKKGKGAQYVGDKTFDGQTISFDKITFSDKNRNKTAIKLTGSKAQKKTFDFDGLTLSREPNEIEKLIDLKSLVSDLDAQSESLENSLLKYRDALINQAVSAAKDLDSQTIHRLTLERNEKLARTVNKSLQESYETGRAQIIREINAQKSAKNLSNLEFKDLSLDELKEKLRGVSDSVIAKLLNEIQSRAVNIYVALKLLGFEAGDFFDELKKRLLGESSAFVSQTSRNAANLVIQTGRRDEIEAQTENWDRIQYSAILDKNTCPACKKEDGKEAENESELEDVPNPYCDGQANCRCFHVVILD